MDCINVDIRYLDTVEWHDKISCSFDVSKAIDVWRINIGKNQGYVPEFQKLLSPDELINANRFYHEKDKKQFIISRGALRLILEKYLDQPAATIQFGVDNNKKPFVKTTGQALNYNISHSNEWIVIAVSNKAVGIDTEKIDRSFYYKDILPDNFSQEEIDYINQNRFAESFYLLWTRKESIVKLTGQGLDDRLKSIPSLNGNYLISSEIINSSKAIQISSFRPDGGNLATVASESDMPMDIRFWDAEF